MVAFNFLLMVVFGALISLKLTGNTTMSWWVILTPVWVVIAFDFIVWLLKQGQDSAGHFGSFFRRRRRMREIMDMPVEPAKKSSASDSANWWSR
jgi:hypothetical protein